VRVGRARARRAALLLRLVQVWKTPAQSGDAQPGDVWLRGPPAPPWPYERPWPYASLRPARPARGRHVPAPIWHAWRPQSEPRSTACERAAERAGAVRPEAAPAAREEAQPAAAVLEAAVPEPVGVAAAAASSVAGQVEVRPSPMLPPGRRRPGAGRKGACAKDSPTALLHRPHRPPHHDATNRELSNPSALTATRARWHAKNERIGLGEDAGMSRGASPPVREPWLGAESCH
jgi:hypothetical protein